MREEKQSIPCASSDVVIMSVYDVRVPIKSNFSIFVQLMYYHCTNSTLTILD